MENKNRVIVFKSVQGFFMTPIISHTIPWQKAAHKFIQAKTLEKFEKLSVWAQGTRVTKMSRNYSGREADEHLLVYEDLGTTGFTQIYTCSQCGYTESVRFFPDGRISRIPTHCVQCGDEMTCEGHALTKEKWETAIQMLHSRPGDFLIGDKPVKILKIIGFENGDIQHQVLFRDWTTAIINKLHHSPDDDIPNLSRF